MMALLIEQGGVTNEVIYNIPGWVCFGVLFVLFAVGSEIGLRLGRRAAATPVKESEGHIATVEGALLGLLALLLSFAFSMAMGRYEARRSAIVREVNDLETTYLRADLLPAARIGGVKALLREYADARAAYLQAGGDRQRIVGALRRLTDLQRSLWREAAAAVPESPNPVTIGYFISSLNALIDRHTERVAAVENSVPRVILFLLVFVGTLSVAMTGYSAGLRPSALFVPRLLLVLMTAATLIVILDLDRPRRGFMTVAERSLVELQGELEP